MGKEKMVILDFGLEDDGRTEPTTDAQWWKTVPNPSLKKE